MQNKGLESTLYYPVLCSQLANPIMLNNCGTHVMPSFYFFYLDSWFKSDVVKPIMFVSEIDKET